MREPTLAEAASKPKRAVVLALSVVLGAILGMVVAFVVEFVQKARSRERRFS